MTEKRHYDSKAYELLGGIDGIRALATCFYDIMSTSPEARRIRNMHKQDIAPTREKFTLFLCGWLGGPALYKEKYGAIDLTGLHSFLNINEADRDMWLSCMERALEKQPIEDDFKKYLLQRFQVPAEKICNWCQQQLQSPLHFTDLSK